MDLWSIFLAPSASRILSHSRHLFPVLAASASLPIFSFAKWLFISAPHFFARLASVPSLRLGEERSGPGFLRILPKLLRLMGLGHAREKFRCLLLYLFRRVIVHVRGDRPFMTERVGELAIAVAPERIHQRHGNFRSCSDGPGKQCIGVYNGEVQGGRGAFERIRSHPALHLRE